MEEDRATGAVAGAVFVIYAVACGQGVVTGLLVLFLSKAVTWQTACGYCREGPESGATVAVYGMCILVFVVLTAFRSCMACRLQREH